MAEAPRADGAAGPRALLRAHDGKESEVLAEIAQISSGARAARTLVPIAAGVLFGAMFLPVPGLHFFAPWALPLLGLGIGLYMSRVRASVSRVSGPCPRCGAQVEAADLGSVGADPVWLRCPGCGAPLELRVEQGQG